MSNQSPPPKTKPVVFVSTAVLIISSMDEVREMVSKIWSGQPLPARMSDIPAVGEWLPLYREHRRIVRVVGGIMPEFGQESPADLVGDEWREFIRMNQQQKVEALKELSPEQLQLFSVLIGQAPFPPDDKTIKAMVKQFDDPKNDPSDDAMGSLVTTPEMQFFVRVWFPCLVGYRTYPPLLFHKARCGDIDALDDLIRLDKSVLADRLIAQRWHEVVHGRAKGPRNKLLRAVAGRPHGKLSRAKFVPAIAGLVSQMAKAFKCPVTEPEIRDLIQKVAKAKHGKPDTNVPLSSWTFSKAIQRQRRWPSLT